MKCMRCDLPRWTHPEKGPTVLCEFHAMEVFSGRAKAPPLRTRQDYVYPSRKVFLAELAADEPEEPVPPPARLR